jgi:hypothetical protein
MRYQALSLCGIAHWLRVLISDNGMVRPCSRSTPRLRTMPGTLPSRSHCRARAVISKDRTLVDNIVDVRRFPDHQPAAIDAWLHPADVVPIMKRMLGFCCCAEAGTLAAASNASRPGQIFPVVLT